MSGDPPSNDKVPALFTALGNIVGEHWKEIAGGAGGLGGIVAILNGVFDVQLSHYGDALVQFFTSDGTVTVLLLILLISHVLLYQRVQWIVEQLEPKEQPHKSEINENEEVLTDGGSSNLPPRNSKGQFTTRESGGSNLFLLLLAAITGYLVGDQISAIDPIATALIAVALIAFFQSKTG